MNLAELRTFCAVIQEGTVKAAAARLNTVPSNVTARLQHLEETLGEALFRRERKRLFLSEAGERLLPYARRIVALDEEARAVFGQGERIGHLRLGAMESTAASRLPTLLNIFHQHIPDTRVSLKTGTTQGLLDGLRRAEFDAVFVDLTPQSLNVDIVGFDRFAAFDEELMLVHPFCDDDLTARTPIKHLPALVFGAGCSYRNRLLSWFEQQGATPQIVEMTSYHAIIACVAAGAGVSLVPRSVLALLVSDVVAMTPFPNGHAQTVMVWKHGRVSPMIKELKELMFEKMREKTNNS